MRSPKYKLTREDSLQQKTSGRLQLNGQVEEDEPKNDSGNREASQRRVRARDCDVREPLEERAFTERNQVRGRWKSPLRLAKWPWGTLLRAK